MKITLIQPPDNEYVLSIGRFEPLSLEILAASVEKRHLVKIIDLQYEKSLKNHLEVFSPNIVGISAMSTHAKKANEIMQEVKNFNENIITIIGGNHASMLPEYFNKPYVDYIVSNHGFETFPALVEALSTNQNIESVDGIIIIKNGKMLKTHPRDLNSIKSIPTPNRQLTRKYRKKYHMFHLSAHALVNTAIGCPYRCNFCACWKYTKGKYFTRTPEEIIKDLLTLKEKRVFFADDNTFYDVKRAHQIADLIKINAINKYYTAYARADTIAKHPDLFIKWKKIGLQRLIVGIEEIDDKELLLLNKKSSIDTNELAIKTLNKIGIVNFAHFIIRQDFQKEKFINLKHYIYKNELFFSTFPILTPLPGTEIWDERRSELISENFDLFDLSHSLLPTKIPLYEFLDLIKKLYESNFSTTRYIKFRLKLLFNNFDKKNHKDMAPFFLWLWMKIGFYLAMKKMIKNHNLIVPLKKGYNSL